MRVIEERIKRFETCLVGGKVTEACTYIEPGTSQAKRAKVKAILARVAAAVRLDVAHRCRLDSGVVVGPPQS